MTAVYPDSLRVEAYLVATWTDITSDVIREPIAANWGITNNTAVDLVADGGSLVFLLNNVDDKYIPGHTSATTGWDKNTPIRLFVVYQDDDYVRFRGYVDDLDIISEDFNRKQVRVTCIDYMDYLAKTPLVSPAIQEDKRADEALTTLVAALPIAPQSTSYEEGQETFLTVFDAVTPKTKAYSEAVKLVNSEFGYLYSKKDKINGETLVFEDRHFRNGLRTLSQVPIERGYSLLLETGDHLLLEDSGNLLLDKLPFDAEFDNSMTSLKMQYGEDVVNFFKTTAYPKGISASAEVLFNLESTIELGSGEVLVFRTNYADPTGGNQINAVSTSMETPVATTDYLLNAQSDGGGADLTANFTVTADYGTDGVGYTLRNSSASIGYVTHLQARGIGVYSYNPISDEAKSAASQLAYGYHVQKIDQRYQQTPELGQRMGNTIVGLEKDPRVDLQKVRFVANRSVELMAAFLTLDVGDLIHIKEDDAEIDDYFYIQGVDFMIDLGGVIRFTWTVALMISLISGGLTPVAIEFFGAGSDDGTFYGVVPEVLNLEKRTMAAWVKIPAFSGTSRTIFSLNGDGARTFFYSGSDGKLKFYSTVYTGAAGWWVADNTHAVDTLIHVAVTHDVSVNELADPILYINGSAIAITESLTPAGTRLSETGKRLGIGKVYYLLDYEMEGQIADPRIHDVILTSTELTTLYNAGNPDESLVTRGLVFQGFNVKTADYAGLLDTVLDNSDKLIDNIYNVIGASDSSADGTGGDDGTATLRVFP